MNSLLRIEEGFFLALVFWLATFSSASLALALETLQVEMKAPLSRETVKLKSGREVQLVDGEVPEKVAEEIYRAAEQLLKHGRIDLAGEYWQLIVDKTKGGIVSRAIAAQEKRKKIEYGSFVVLKSAKVLRGKVNAHIRAHLLGLEGNEEIPLWQVEEIVAEYHPEYSFVSESFYPLTKLRIKLRAQERRASRITGEVEFVVEAADGSTTKTLLGKEYVLLRPKDASHQLETMIADRIVRVVIYPDLGRSNRVSQMKE